MEQGLERRVGLGAAIAILVGEIIAVGIFLTPAEMTKSIGSPLLILLVWLVMAAMALAGALCYAELAARFPEAGGGYVYLREAYGKRVAFLYGWKSVLVMDPGITAALGLGLADYIGRICGVSVVASRAVAIATILSLALVNVLGVRIGAMAMWILAVVKVSFLLLFVVVAFSSGSGHWGNFSPFVAQHAGSQPIVGALAGGLISAFFAFGGWWDLSKLAGEIRDPARTLPTALAAGVIVVAAIYIATSAAFVFLVPIDSIQDGAAFAAQAGAAIFGPAGELVFSIVVIVAITGSLTGLLFAAPRVYFAMARDRIFVESLGRLHPQFGTPARAIVLQAVLASGMVAVATFTQIISYFIFVTVVFIGATAVAVVSLRKKLGPPVGFSMPLYPVPIVSFCLLTGLVLLLLLAGRPFESLLGTAVVLFGLPVFTFVERKRRTPGD